MISRFRRPQDLPLNTYGKALNSTMAPVTETTFGVTDGFILRRTKSTDLDFKRSESTWIGLEEDVTPRTIDRMYGDSRAYNPFCTFVLLVNFLCFHFVLHFVLILDFCTFSFFSNPLCFEFVVFLY